MRKIASLFILRRNSQERAYGILCPYPYPSPQRRSGRDMCRLRASERGFRPRTPILSSRFAILFPCVIVVGVEGANIVSTNTSNYTTQRCAFSTNTSQLTHGSRTEPSAKAPGIGVTPPFSCEKTVLLSLFHRYRYFLRCLHIRLISCKRYGCGIFPFFLEIYDLEAGLSFLIGFS